MFMMQEPKRKVTEEEQKAINTFQAPPLLQGQQVTYWPNGIRDNNGTPGWVTRKTEHNRTTALFVAGWGAMKDVPHIDDPRLLLNRHQRSRGAWEYTEAFKAEMARYEEIRKLVEEVRALVGGKPEPKAPPKKPVNDKAD